MTSASQAHRRGHRRGLIESQNNSASGRRIRLELPKQFLMFLKDAFNPWVRVIRFLNFWRKASLRVFSYATLSDLNRKWRGQLICRFTRSGLFCVNCSFFLFLKVHELELESTTVNCQLTIWRHSNKPSGEKFNAVQAVRRLFPGLLPKQTLLRSKLFGALFTRDQRKLEYSLSKLIHISLTSEPESTKRSFALKIKIWVNLTRSFASLFFASLRSAIFS